MSPQLSFEETLRNISEQHEQITSSYRRFLSESSSNVVRSLREENEALNCEVASLRGKLRRIFGGQDFTVAPPIPHLPGVVPRNGGAKGATAPASAMSAVFHRRPATVAGAICDVGCSVPGACDNSASTTCSPAPVSGKDLCLDNGGNGVTWGLALGDEDHNELMAGRRSSETVISPPSLLREAAAMVGEPGSPDSAVGSGKCFDSRLRDAVDAIELLSEEEKDPLGMTMMTVMSDFSECAKSGRKIRRRRVQLQSRKQEKARSLEQRRLRTLLGLRSGVDEVDSVTLASTLEKRDHDMDVDVPRAAHMIAKVKALHSKMHLPTFRGDTATPDGSIDLDVLLDLLLAPEGSFSASGDALILLNALKVITVEEVVNSASRGACFGAAEESPQEMVGPLTHSTTDPKPTQKMQVLNTVVTVVVLLNISMMGLSVDHSPDHVGWIVFEFLCASVFFTEAVMKISHLGCQGYFRGVAWHWNVCDFLVTLVSMADVAFSIFFFIFQSMTSFGNLSAAVRVAVVGRVLRVVRLVRLVKLVKSPFMRDLANMLVGFVIGMPSLFWVLIVFCVLLYVFGLVFRILFGPVHGDAMANVCPTGDDMLEFEEEVAGVICKTHLLYGAEFFGSVTKAMFTAFRFMLGDYSTRNGKSIVVAFSMGYGKKFDFVFVGWMIIVIFGFFNIVTAIFVESTTAGLKHNDFKRKYQMQYERRYVMRKLELLIRRVRQVHEKRPSLVIGMSQDEMATCGSTLGPAVNLSKADIAHITITEQDFDEIMEDEKVKEYMEALDISVFNPVGLFDTLDPEGTGFVTLPSMVQSLMKLRGEPMKNDIIASWVSLRALHEKFDRMQGEMQILQAHVFHGNTGNSGRRSPRPPIHKAIPS